MSDMPKRDALMEGLKGGKLASNLVGIDAEDLQKFYESKIWKAHLELWSTRAHQHLVQLMISSGDPVADAKIRGAFAELLTVINSTHLKEKV